MNPSLVSASLDALATSVHEWFAFMNGSDE